MMLISDGISSGGYQRIGNMDGEGYDVAWYYVSMDWDVGTTF